jgi:hypothetical protein
MDPQIIGGLLGFFGGILSSVITTWAIFHARRSADRALEKDEIRKRKVEIIYQLLGSRYILSEAYNPSAGEVMVFNTAMALFSVYFAKDQGVATAYDRMMTNKTTENLLQMLSVAARTADLELLDSTLGRVMSVKATLQPFAIHIQTSDKPTVST